MSVAREIEVIHLPGLRSYAEMLETQRARRDAVAAGDAPNTLYLLEHAPVLTCGRDFHRENLLLPVEQIKDLGVAIEMTDRGGDVTYHGPGQLVAYPILRLSEWKPSVSWYLRSLEQVIINLLAEWGLKGKRVEGLTGVWVEGAKVAAIGVGLHRWATFHGAAINVSPNLSHFGLIIPCGIADRPVTSLEKLMPSVPQMTEVAARFEAQFRRVFIEEAIA